MVEFEIENGITDVEAVRLIDTPIDKSKKAEGDGWKQELSDTHQMLRLDDEIQEDPFAGKLVNYEVEVQQLHLFVNKFIIVSREAMEISYQ